MLSSWSDAAEQLIAALLGGGPELNLDELAEEAGLEPEFAQRYWQLMGLPVTDPSAREFTHEDANALRHLAQASSREGLDDRTMGTLIRSVGHSTERLSLWHFEALVDHVVRRDGVSDPEARLKVAQEMSRLAPALEKQLVHAWRRQMAALVGRQAVEFGAGVRRDSVARAEGGELPLPRAVGFADIVSFTRLTAQLGASEFAEFIQTFETRARDIVTANGGRVVKTVGDALLFIADDVVTGADVALSLASADEADMAVAGYAGRPVRVSLVWGRVLSRFGDVFGPSVNLASRLTDQAAPSTVLMDQVTAHRLVNNPRFAQTTLEPREVAGLGVLTPVRLDWARAPEAH